MAQVSSGVALQQSHSCLAMHSFEPPHRDLAEPVAKSLVSEAEQTTFAHHGERLVDYSGESSEYSITLDKKLGTRLCVKFEREPSGHMLRIGQIDAGLITDWNKAHRGQAVKPGDLLVKANGVAGDAKALLAECKKDGKLVLKLRRTTEPPNKQKSGAMPPYRDTAEPEVGLPREYMKEEETVMTSCAGLSVRIDAREDVSEEKTVMTTFAGLAAEETVMTSCAGLSVSVDTRIECRRLQAGVVLHVSPGVDRPVETYTIRRCLGTGGFGAVYEVSGLFFWIGLQMVVTKKVT